jgi:hypothetical protein
MHTVMLLSSKWSDKPWLLVKYTYIIGLAFVTVHCVCNTFILFLPFECPRDVTVYVLKRYQMDMAYADAD